MEKTIKIELDNLSEEESGKLMEDENIPGQMSFEDFAGIMPNQE